MDSQSLYAIFAIFMTLLTNNKDDNQKSHRAQKLQLDTNSQRCHLQDGLSPYSVLSTLSGSLSPDALVFLVIFLFIQTCAAAFQEDEVTSSDGSSYVSSTTPTPKGDEVTSYLKNNTTPTADPSSSLCLPHVYFYAIFTCVAAAVLLFAFLLVVWTRNHTGKAKESKSTEDLIRNLTEDETQGRDRERESAEDPTPASPEQREKEDTVSTLNEHQTETTKLRDELLSQLEEVEREKEENKKRLHSVEKELETETGHKNQELLREKTNLLESKWKLDEMKTEKEKVLLQTDKLLRTIDTVTNKMTGHKLM